MSLKRKMIAMFVGQGYVSLIGIVTLPFYMRWLGKDAFGLVGIYILLQSALPLLEFGFAQSLSREVSRWRAGTLAINETWLRLRSTEALFGGMAVAASLALVLGRHWVADHWLLISGMGREEVASCLAAMAVAVAIRWWAGLYRAALIGAERQTWVNGTNAALATVRAVGVLPVLAYWSAAPLTFFAFQAGVACIEFLLYRAALYRILPQRRAGLRPDWRSLGAMWPMAKSMALLGTIWIAISQIDKLVLSKTLPLDAYGYFTLAAAAASGVQILAAPMSQVLQPRMTILAESGQADNLITLYRLSSQLATALFISLGGTMAAFAGPLLAAWTGNMEATRAAAPVLFWYGLANGLVGISMLPFMLQFAFGYLRLHVIGNLILLFVLLPVLIVSAVAYGAVGAGIVLVLARLLFLLGWVPRVHRRLLPKLAWTWPIRDVGVVAAVVAGVLVVAHGLFPDPLGRLSVIITVGLALVVSLSAGILAGDLSRKLLLDTVKSWK